MILVNKSPYIVETNYHNAFKVKIVLSELFDKFLIDYINENQLKIGDNIGEHYRLNKKQLENGK